LYQVSILIFLIWCW